MLEALPTNVQEPMTTDGQREGRIPSDRKSGVSARNSDMLVQGLQPVRASYLWIDWNARKGSQKFVQNRTRMRSTCRQGRVAYGLVA
jgi:hypothetical protein